MQPQAKIGDLHQKTRTIRFFCKINTNETVMLEANNIYITQLFNRGQQTNKVGIFYSLTSFLDNLAESLVSQI